MVGANACRDGELELLCLCKALCGEVARVESIVEEEDVSFVDCSSWLRGGLVETYGVVMITSASTSSWSNFEFSPSLSEVVTRVCPCSSSHLRMPSSFSVVPNQFASEDV
jgi:hypothetical protein